MGWCDRIGRRRFVTRAPLVVSWGDQAAGLSLEVPAGFEFDVSVPRVLWWAFSPVDPRFLRAAAVHDYALSLGWTREQAAAPFGHELRRADVARLERLAMVLGVIVWKWR